jgi:hypothetical protein
MMEAPDNLLASTLPVEVLAVILCLCPKNARILCKTFKDIVDRATTTLAVRFTGAPQHAPRKVMRYLFNKLNTVSTFPNLTTLELTGGWPNEPMSDVDFSTAASSIRFMRSWTLPNLTKLSIGCCMQTVDFGFLSTFTNLARLTLRECESIIFERLPSLRELEIQNCLCMEELALDELRKLTGLTKFTITMEECAFDVTPLSVLTNLASLSISTFDGVCLQALSSLTSLTHLDVNGGCTNSIDLSPIASHPSLDSLSMMEFGLDGPQWDASHLKNLRHLDLHIFNDDPLDMGQLSSLKELRTLRLCVDGCDKVDISGIEFMTHLESVEITG